MNWNRTSSHQIWGKWSYLDAVVDDRTYFLVPDPIGTGDGGNTKVTQWTGGHTWTLSPSMVLDSTFGYSGQKQDVLGPDANIGNFGLDVLGIPGTNDQGIGDDRYAGYPEFAPASRNLGNYEGWMPIFRDERTYSFATNVTKIKGQHEFRGGYMVNFLRLNHWQPELDNPRGRFDFTTRGTTALNGGSQAANFYNSLGGVPARPGRARRARASSTEEMTGREWQHGFFVRDRWTVSSKLTLDLGVRWEYYPIMQRADRGIERLDFQTLEILLGGTRRQPAEPRPRGVEEQLRAAPRRRLPHERGHGVAQRASA